MHASGVTDAMWSLRELQYDQAVPGDEVLLPDERGQLETVAKGEAITRAHAAGLHLVALWPEHLAGGPAVCDIRRLQLPPTWELVTDEVLPETPEHDPELWFVGLCGGRDVLLGNGHTSRGRMAAWCPDDGRQYFVSLAGMGEMSRATTYWVDGFLHGAEPGPPQDDDGDISLDELPVWRAATARFRRTGLWLNRWSTCRSCGRVLRPDAEADECESHIGSA